MTAPRRESFLRGALVLTGAGLLVRLIGVAQRIPLYRLLGPEGSGIYALPYSLYSIMLSISSVGINIAISRLIAEHLALGDGRGAARVFRVSLGMMAALGLLMTGLLLAASDWLAARVHLEPRAALSYVATAPAILFVSVMSAYRGYFQGLQRMTPNANSQVLEQIVRVVTMLALAYWLLPRGLEWAAAGANFGAATGAAAAWLYLWLIYLRERERDRAHYGLGAPSPPAPSHRPSDPTPALALPRLMGRILTVAAPVSLAGLVMPLIHLADAILVTQRLQAGGASREMATTQFGQLANVAVPLVNLPTILTSSLFIALVPAIAELAVVGDIDRIRLRSQTALRVTFLVTLPAMAGLYLLGDEIAGFLYGDSDAGPVLKSLSAATLFLGLQQTTSGILQGLGEMVVPVRNFLIGAGVKVILTYVLVAQPLFGVNGASYGTAIGLLVAAGLNILAVTARIGSVLHYSDMAVRPGLATAAMALASRGAYAAVLGAPWLPPGLSTGAQNALATVCGIGAGAVVYGVALLLVGGLRQGDVELIPRVGPSLARILAGLHLLRD